MVADASVLPRGTRTVQAEGLRSVGGAPWYHPGPWKGHGEVGRKKREHQENANQVYGL